MKRILIVLTSVAVLATPIADAKDKKAYENELEAKVKVVMNPAHVEECELLGLVESKTRAAIWTGYKKNKRAYTKIREKALEMGGNAVLLFESKNSSTTTRLQGEAYLCTAKQESAKEAETKTIEAIKAVQLACEAYAVDWAFYPSAESMVELRPIVTPTYMYDHDLPDLDGFGNPLAIHSDPDGYVIGSAGPDGIGNTDDDYCLSQDLRLTRGSCGLDFPAAAEAS